MINNANNTKPFYNTTIPSDWEVKTVGKTVETISIPYKYKTKEYLQFGKYPIVDQGKNEIVGYSSNETHLIKDLPVVVFGDHTKILKYIDFPFCVGSDGTKLLKSKIAISRYLFYALLNSIEKLPDLAYSRYFSELKTIKLPIPRLPEQRAIAHVLSLMDSVINKNKQLIAQKEFRKKWLMQNLLTGKKRLKGFSGESKKVGAGEVFKSFTKKGFENEELLSATQDRGIIPRNQLKGRVTMPEGSTKGYKLVEAGDFVISLRSFQGGLEYSYYRGIVSPAYIVLKPKEKIYDEFYKQYFKSYEFIGRLATAVIGIRDGKQISYDDFCIVKIPFPSYEEQTAIAQVLQAADTEIALLKAKTEKLREQKKGMMQVLLTGKKRLKIN